MYKNSVIRELAIELPIGTLLVSSSYLTSERGWHETSLQGLCGMGVKFDSRSQLVGKLKEIAVSLQEAIKELEEEE